MSDSDTRSSPTTSSDIVQSDARNRRRRSPRHRLLFAVLYGTYIGLLGWVAIRGYFWMRYDVSIAENLSTDQLWRVHYPKLHSSGVETATIERDDARFDVLLLGGSVLEQVVDQLESELRRNVGDRARVFNLCTAAHTTRDSYWKFKRLAARDFDLIVVYHGINDARMNCCPPADFRDDYTHCGHYETIERQLIHGNASMAEIVLRDVGCLIPLRSPEPEFLDYGGTVKTADPFRQNIELIVQSSSERRRPVLLMTFAYHLPLDYSRQAFDEKKLDYGKGQYQMEAEVWGRAEHLRATIDTHNAQIRRLAADYKNVILVDQVELLPSSGRYFSDPCHLTSEGKRQFVKNMLPAILQVAR